MDQIKRYTLIFAFIILGVIVLTPLGFVIYFLRDIFFYIIIAYDYFSYGKTCSAGVG